ncbi:MAG: ATP-dependent sacrificial sulfur transferase LarE [Lachnospiraceae bacterium]
MKSYREKVEELKRRMEGYSSEAAAVAFSGGVDSSLLLKMACDGAKETGQKVYGIFLHTMLHPAEDAGNAERVAKEAGAEFVVLKVDELAAAGIEDNPVNRCYLCKKCLFTELRKKAEELGVRRILEGTNEDDLHVYRPGIQAVRELGILSPLAEAGLTKKEVRSLAREYGISVSGRASSPCLATRFPYGTRLCYEDMRRVEKGEEHLKKLGLFNVRLRVHKDVARIEVDSDALLTVVHFRKEITDCLKKLGYTYVTLDLEGFRSGSMDVTLIRYCSHPAGAPVTSSGH